MLLLTDSADFPTTAPELPGPQHVAPAPDAGSALAETCRAQRARV